MNREERSRANAKLKHDKAKKLVINTVTGIFANEYKKPNGEWHIGKIAEATHLHRDTVAKHLKIWESNIGGLFEDEYSKVQDETNRK